MASSASVVAQYQQEEARDFQSISDKLEWQRAASPIPNEMVDSHRAFLLSAIPFVLDEFGIWCDLYDDEVRASKGDFTCTLWWFHWDFAIEKGDKQIFIRDVVNLHEFREQLSEAESKRHSRFITIQPLERQTKVGEDGTVLYDHAFLNATFSKDGPCDECGKMSKNGRATCLCPFDQDDINKMDLALRRQ